MGVLGNVLSHSLGFLDSGFIFLPLNYDSVSLSSPVSFISVALLLFFANFHVQIWANRLLSMYIKWAKRKGYKGRIVEKCHSPNGGIKSATIEFEFEFAYGYLSGEKGVHYMIRNSSNDSALQEV